MKLRKEFLSNNFPQDSYSQVIGFIDAVKITPSLMPIMMEYFRSVKDTLRFAQQIEIQKRIYTLPERVVKNYKDEIDSISALARPFTQPRSKTERDSTTGEIRHQLMVSENGQLLITGEETENENLKVKTFDLFNNSLPIDAIILPSDITLFLNRRHNRPSADPISRSVYAQLPKDWLDMFNIFHEAWHLEKLPEGMELSQLQLALERMHLFQSFRNSHIGKTNFRSNALNISNDHKIDLNIVLSPFTENEGQMIVKEEQQANKKALSVFEIIVSAVGADKELINEARLLCESRIDDYRKHLKHLTQYSTTTLQLIQEHNSTDFDITDPFNL